MEALIDDRRGWLLFWCGALLLVKEDTPLFIAGIGLVFAAIRDWRWAAGFLAGSVAAFGLLTLVVIPSLQLHRHVHLLRAESTTIRRTPGSAALVGTVAAQPVQRQRPRAAGCAGRHGRLRPAVAADPGAGAHAAGQVRLRPRGVPADEVLLRRPADGDLRDRPGGRPAATAAAARPDHRRRSGPGGPARRGWPPDCCWWCWSTTTCTPPSCRRPSPRSRCPISGCWTPPG